MHYDDDYVKHLERLLLMYSTRLIRIEGTLECIINQNHL